MGQCDSYKLTRHDVITEMPSSLNNLPGLPDGTAQHHAEDHAEDLDRGREWREVY